MCFLYDWFFFDNAFFLFRFSVKVYGPPVSNENDHWKHNVQGRSSPKREAFENDLFPKGRK